MVVQSAMGVSSVVVQPTLGVSSVSSVVVQPTMGVSSVVMPATGESSVVSVVRVVIAEAAHCPKTAASNPHRKTSVDGSCGDKDS